jgi:hypothetical protein
MKIIGIIGPAGAGKSSAAAHLAARYGAQRYAFADPLKEIAMRTLDLTREQCYGTQAQKEAIDPRYGFSARSFLQKLGTEGCRHVLGANVWIDALVAKLRRERPGVAVIEDMRFENEAAAIRAMNLDGNHHAGGETVAEVWRLEPPGGFRASTDTGTHASEREWTTAPHDQVVAPAVFGLEHLHDAIDAAWARVGSPRWPGSVPGVRL